MKIEPPHEKQEPRCVKNSLPMQWAEMVKIRKYTLELEQNVLIKTFLLLNFLQMLRNDPSSILTRKCEFIYRVYRTY